MINIFSTSKTNNNLKNGLENKQENDLKLENGHIGIGGSFGLTSGIITSIGLLVSSFNSIGNEKIIIIMLISLAFSDGFSDALGIYYSTYDEKDNIYYSINEAFNAFLGKSIIPLAIAFFIYIIVSVKKKSLYAAMCICLFICTVGFIIINYYIFHNNYKLQIINIFVYIFVIFVNYKIGKFEK